MKVLPNYFRFNLWKYIHDCIRHKNPLKTRRRWRLGGTERNAMIKDSGRRERRWQTSGEDREVDTLSFLSWIWRARYIVIRLDSTILLGVPLAWKLKLSDWPQFRKVHLGLEQRLAWTWSWLKMAAFLWKRAYNCVQELSMEINKFDTQNSAQKFSMEISKYRQTCAQELCMETVILKLVLKIWVSKRVYASPCSRIEYRKEYLYVNQCSRIEYENEYTQTWAQ